MSWKSRIGGLAANLSWDIGVDLGSSNLVIYLKDRGVIVDEPSVLVRLKKKRWTGLSAPKSEERTAVAFGFRAKTMTGREPNRLEVVRPIRGGMIADLEGAGDLVSYYLRLVYEVPWRYPRLFKPRVVVGVPGGGSGVQRRAIRSIFRAAGAGRVVEVEQGVLAALGLGLPMNKSAGVIVVDMGGGKTEISVVSMGGVVLAKSVETAGDDVDEAIINFVRMKYGLLIGENTAERVKIEIADLSGSLSKKEALIRGRDLESGLPKSIRLLGGEVREAILMEAGKIGKGVAEILNETPPELMDDLLKKGVVLVGRGANLRGLDKLIEKETGINTSLSEEPGLAVIKGIERVLTEAGVKDSIRLVSGLG